jgi:hypothetical protein
MSSGECRLREHRKFAPWQGLGVNAAANADQDHPILPMASRISRPDLMVGSIREHSTAAFLSPSDEL